LNSPFLLFFQVKCFNIPATFGGGDIKNSNMAPEYFSGIISELIQKLFTAKQDFYIRFE